MSDSDTLLKFPCIFPIKAMGRSEAGFDDLVVEIVRRYAPDLREGAVKTRASRQGNWISVTVTIQATSKRQLDAIYQALTDHEKVVMCL